MPFVLIMAAVGFCIGLWLTPENTYVNQWVAECHSRGGAAVYVYTSAALTKRFNCLDAKRVDMRDNDQ